MSVNDLKKGQSALLYFIEAEPVLFLSPHSEGARTIQILPLFSIYTA